MPYYTQIVTRSPNPKGRLRLDPGIRTFPNAVNKGFDRDGTPPKRGRGDEAMHRHVVWFKTPLPTPLPVGVVLLPKPAYNALVELRERTKPLPPPIVPPRILTQEGLVYATYVERLSSGTAGTFTPPNSARIILDRWDDDLDAVVSADDGGPNFKSPVDADGDVVSVSLDGAGNWALSAAPSAFPVHLIYFAVTEVGNYTDDSQLLPEKE